MTPSVTPSATPSPVPSVSPGQEKTVTLSFWKIASDTQKGLAGAWMELLEEGGRLLEAWVSTQEAHEVKGLVCGKNYILRETYAPKGYGRISQIPFAIDAQGRLVLKETLAQGILREKEDGSGIYLVEDPLLEDKLGNIQVVKTLSALSEENGQAVRMGAKEEISFSVGLFAEGEEKGAAQETVRKREGGNETGRENESGNENEIRRDGESLNLILLEKKRVTLTKGAFEGTVSFTGLAPGKYYVYELDEKDKPLQPFTLVEHENHMTYTCMGGESEGKAGFEVQVEGSKTVTITLKNLCIQWEPEEKKGRLWIEKKVLEGAGMATDSREFFANLYYLDEQGNQKGYAGNPVRLLTNGQVKVEVPINGSSPTTYLIREADANGRDLTGKEPDFGYEITVEPSLLVIKPEEEARVVITNRRRMPSPTLSPTSRPTPSVTPSPTPSLTPSVTPSLTPTITVTPSVTVTPSITVTPSVTVTPTGSVTPTVTGTTASPSPAPSASPSVSPSVSPSTSPSPSPEAFLSITPSVSPSPGPSTSPSPGPSASPSPGLSVSPSPSPSPSPKEEASLTVRKVLKYELAENGGSGSTKTGQADLYLSSGSFEVGLFSDRKLTNLVCKGTISFQDACSSTITFKGLMVGTTYYLAELDKDGQVFQGNDKVKPVFVGGKTYGVAILSKKSEEMEFKNVYTEFPREGYVYSELELEKDLYDINGHLVPWEKLAYMVTTPTSGGDSRALDENLWGNQGEGNLTPAPQITTREQMQKALGSPVFLLGVYTDKECLKPAPVGLRISKNLLTMDTSHKAVVSEVVTVKLTAEDMVDGKLKAVLYVSELSAKTDANDQAYTYIPVSQIKDFGYEVKILTREGDGSIHEGGSVEVYPMGTSGYSRPLVQVNNRFKYENQIEATPTCSPTPTPVTTPDDSPVSEEDPEDPDDPEDPPYYEPSYNPYHVPTYEPHYEPLYYDPSYEYPGGLPVESAQVHTLQKEDLPTISAPVATGDETELLHYGILLLWAGCALVLVGGIYGTRRRRAGRKNM